jgi:superoxide dismutase, Cu-Zn family
METRAGRRALRSSDEGGIVKRSFTVMLAAAAGLVFSSPAAFAADAATAHAKLADASGKEVGTVEFRQTPNGVIVHAEFAGLPPGAHAFHVHGVGKCEPPFDSAGPHFNPENHQHGFAVDGGWHSGDMPNITVPADGKLTIDVLASELKVSDGDEKMLDADGAAVIVHEGVDDYSSQPAGNAGKRIACGVVQAGPAK